MFTGRHASLMDDRGRVAFPAPLRPLIRSGDVDDTFVLTQSLFDRCLVATTREAFDARLAKVLQGPQSSPFVVHFKRFVVAPAVEIVVDKHGRIVIPRELRDYAELERETLWLNLGDSIEVWSKRGHDELQRATTTRDPEALRNEAIERGL